MSKKQKKVRTAEKTNLNKDFRDQWRVTTDSNSPGLKIKAPVPSRRASVSIYKAQCMVLPVFTGQQALTPVIFFKINVINKYDHRFLVHERVWCKFGSVLLRDFG